MLNSKDSLKDLVNKGILKQRLVNRITETLAPDYGLEAEELLLVEDIIEAINNGELSSKTPGIGKFYWREIEHKFISNNKVEEQEEEFSAYVKPYDPRAGINSKAVYPAVTFSKNNGSDTIRVSFLSQLSSEMGDITSINLYINKDKSAIKLIYGNESKSINCFRICKSKRSPSNAGYNIMYIKDFLKDNPKFSIARYKATHDKANKTIIIRAEDKL